MQSASSRATWTRYLAAVVAVALTALARQAIDPLLGERSPLLPFTIAVMVAGWYGGLGPGLLATALSAIVGTLLWISPEQSLWIEAVGDRVTLGVFVAIGAAVSLLNETVHQARESAERRARELREREEAHRRILDTASEGICTIARDGTVGYANASMADMLGVPLGALLGRDALDLVYDEDRAAVRDRFRAVLEGERVAFELRLRRPDGSALWSHVSGAPVPDRAGRVVGVLGMFTDVTERHRVEAELQRILESEKRARADAEAANRAKDEFLATVSHELRTPLNAMLGWLTMMRSGSLDAPKTARALEVIERNARSQAKLIEDLLDVSRMISGKLRLERRKVALGAIVQSAIDAVGPAVADKEITVERTFDVAVDLVAGDPERLKQIAVNLLSNAVKFTPQGGRVRVEVRRRGDRMVLAVTDTGQGIAPEFLPHVFDRFRQQEAGTARKHAGLGLGLAIVRHLVELHGGTVQAESEGPGRGARFTVTLPALDDASARGLPSATPVIGVAEARVRSTSLKGSRVLVVDDEPDSLDMLSELLTRAGADVRTAPSASDALATLVSFRPELIVSDLAMPELDGYDLLSRVRALPADRGGATPAIALTAHARLTDRLRVLSSGFSAYLAKPVEAEELIATASRVLGSPPASSLHA